MIAYEPVWAIGSGVTPTPADIAELHGFIRSELGRLLGKAEIGTLRILYGGSVKPANASELLFVPDVDGALVGGASLTAERFLCNSIGLCWPEAGLKSRPTGEQGWQIGAIFAMLLKLVWGRGTIFRRGLDAVAALHCRGACHCGHSGAV